MGAVARDRYPGSGHLEMTILSIARLRQRAAEFRQNALRANSDGIAAELKRFARDYENDALRLEAQVPTIRRADNGP